MISLLIFLESGRCWLWDARNPSNKSRPIWLLNEVGFTEGKQRPVLQFPVRVDVTWICAFLVLDAGETPVPAVGDPALVDCQARHEPGSLYRAVK